MPVWHLFALWSQKTWQEWLVLLLLNVILLPHWAYAQCEAEPPESSAIPLLVGATPAAPCRFPYMASLSRPIFGVHLCGGTLVDASWILTAASCVDVHIGQVPNPNASINGLLQGVPESFQEVHTTLPQELKIHPNHTRGQKGYNVALLRLDTPSKQPLVRLISPEEELEPGEDVAYVGWGRVAGERGGFSPNLMVALDSGVLEPDLCQSFGVQEPGKVWCAGDGVKGICQGDEGGPVLRLGSDASEDVQVGIAGTGSDVCGALGKPSIFTGLSHILQWINETISAGG